MNTGSELVARHKGFTPGPWETQESPNGGLLLIRGNHEDRYKRHPQTHLQIVPEADARLIADAPALLELAQQQARRIAVLEGALQELAMREELYRAAHDLHGDDSRESGYAWDQMRSAGNKARAALEEKQG